MNAPMISSLLQDCSLTLQPAYDLDSAGIEKSGPLVTQGVSKMSEQFEKWL